MEISSNLINSLKNIKASIDEKDQKAWSNEARAKCFKGAIQQLKKENGGLRKNIEMMKKEIEELQSLGKKVEEMNVESLRTIKNGYESAVHHRLYKKMLEDNLKKQKDKCDRIFKAYEEHINTVKQNLRRSSPKYKILQEKQLELKQTQVRCMVLKKKIEELQKINHQKMELRKKKFYTQIINLAKAWTNSREHLADLKRLKELTVQEKYWMKKVMESTEQLQQQQKMRKSKKDACMISIECPENNNKLPETSAENLGRHTVEEKSPDNPYNELENLIEKNLPFSQCFNMDAPAISTKSIFSSNHSKVVVLESKILKSMDTNREEKRKRIEAKLKKFTKIMSKNYSQRLSSQKSKLNISMDTDKSKKIKKIEKIDSWTSQDLNIINQGNPHFLSQEYQHCSEPIENSKHQAGKKLDMKMSQTANQRLSEMKFIPHQKSIFGTESKDFELPHIITKRGFEMKFPENNKMSLNDALHFTQKPQKSQEKSISKQNINSSQSAIKMPAETKFINQGGFFNRGFNNSDSGTKITHNHPKILQDNFSLFSTNINENQDTNANKDSNFNLNDLNFGEPPQFNFGNLTEFSQNVNASYNSLSYCQCLSKTCKTSCIYEVLWIITGNAARKDDKTLGTEGMQQ